MTEKTNEILNEIEKVIIGKHTQIKLILTAIYAGGHILIEDVPGVGKTTSALAFSKVFGLGFTRVQFTPDTVASDIIGYSAYDRETNKFEYRPGSAMTNILLADEINRTSGKTQSALLEVMEEGGCTVDGITYKVPQPFIVLATQNPFGSAGTSKLPESQLDRFMIKISMGYPDKESMKNIMKDRHHENPLDKITEICSGTQLSEIRKQCENIFVADDIYDYIAELCRQSDCNENIALGISPRGALALCKMSKANAFIEGREYVVPDDVRSCFKFVCAHRIVPSSKARIAELTPEQILDSIVEKVKSPEVPVERKH